MTTKHTPGPCPICREIHAPRGLCYDGMGVNSCGMYRERIATIPHEYAFLGPVFASAPQLLEAARIGLQALAILESNGLDTEQDEKDKAFIQQAIAKAEGRE
jgi:hypothetical protein